MKFVEEILSLIKEGVDEELIKRSLECYDDRTAATYANMWRIRTARNGMLGSFLLLGIWIMMIILNSC